MVGAVAIAIRATNRLVGLHVTPSQNGLRPDVYDGNTELAALIRECWHHKPEKRPHARQLATQLAHIAKSMGSRTSVAPEPRVTVAPIVPTYPVVGERAGAPQQDGQEDRSSKRLRSKRVETNLAFDRHAEMPEVVPKVEGLVESATTRDFAAAESAVQPQTLVSGQESKIEQIEQTSFHDDGADQAFEHPDEDDLCDVISSVIAAAGDEESQRRVSVAAAIALRHRLSKRAFQCSKSERAWKNCTLDLRGCALPPLPLHIPFASSLTFVTYRSKVGSLARQSGARRERSQRIGNDVEFAERCDLPGSHLPAFSSLIQRSRRSEVDERNQRAESLKTRDEIEADIVEAFANNDLAEAQRLGALLETKDDD